VSSRALTRCWYAALATLAAFALAGTAVMAIKHGRSLLNFISYFTIESNLLVLLVSGLAALGRLRDRAAIRVLRLAALTGITITALVYATVIAPHTNPKGIDLVNDVILHYVVPSIAVLGFVLIGPRVRFQRSDIAFMAWPALWIVYTMVRGAVSHPGFPGTKGARSRYPYDFLDVNAHGWGSVLPSTLGVTALLIGVAAAYIWMSGRLGDTATKAV
jgi:hypothetical protein